jgi:hypothetical protein
MGRTTVRPYTRVYPQGRGDGGKTTSPLGGGRAGLPEGGIGKPICHTKSANQHWHPPPILWYNYPNKP